MASPDNMPPTVTIDHNTQPVPAPEAKRKVSILTDSPAGYDNMAYDGKTSRKISQVRIKIKKNLVHLHLKWFI